MMMLFQLLFLVTSFGLVGCETQVEHQWSGEPIQAQIPEMAGILQAPQPLATEDPEDDSLIIEEKLLVDLVAAQDHNVVNESKPLSFGDNLSLNSKMYLSKAGELLADLTIENNNVVSVKHIIVHCVEYNMNNAAVREASVTLDKTLQVGESSYWDQVNFGYVDDAFETVQCKIRGANLS